MGKREQLLALKFSLYPTCLRQVCDVQYHQYGFSLAIILLVSTGAMAALTRELDTILFVTLVLLGVILLTKRCQHENRFRWIIPGIVFGATIILFAGITLLFNQALTSNALITPRALNLPYDHWGFGKDVGFYGQHTLAAGFVNMDQLLTTLSFDL